MSTINLSKVNNWLHVVNKLPYLTSLMLYSCNLLNIFSIPLDNSSTSLDVLDLSDNNLTSSSSVLEWLFNSNTSVVELYLGYNQFQGLIPDGFSIIISLAYLSFYNNEFEGGIPKSFGGMCNLKMLTLSSNNLSGQLLGIFHNLTGCANQSIESLNFDWNQIMGSLPNITTFPSLRILRLQSNLLKGIMSESLGKQSNLEILYLSDNSLEGVISEAHFSNLTKFRLLGQFPDSCWMHLKGLEVLSLANNHFHGKIPSSVGFLRGIETLDLGNNNFSGELPSSLKNCKDLIFLNLGYNALAGQIPREIVELVGLVSLNLSRNLLTGQITSKIDMLQSLEALDLSKNQLSGGIPSSLSHIDCLSVLDLSNNNSDKPSSWYL
ncbi:LRR receptor-like serine/threonine-protein kinase RCH1 [Quercus lobata]|uniref:LRR receptor-like serine/threonine-protein kinase RCH1 n=1 Tax=Quercus lobata TaxID=97700 RepID=UPI0012491493|nr:LRR receptor-like serine/threonine-protein kinase RCH1 [Quercus lobata]